MSIVKSFSVGNGDMFYIDHFSDNFTMIDCCLDDSNKEKIVNELKEKINNNGIHRFISTHPDEDHIQNLNYLDDELSIINFYCVKNEATKNDETDGFVRYKNLRAKENTFFVEENCSRKWMNLSCEKTGSSGINFHWPSTTNKDYKEALKKAKNGESPNNISPIFSYSIESGIQYIWMGDLENDFMNKILDDVSLPKNIDVLFAPHHGRKSGKIPKQWLDIMKPKIIIIGEAPSKNLDYSSYNDYDTITQNSAKDIIFENTSNYINIYSSNENYSVDFLEDKNLNNKFDSYYLGSLSI
ncbi:ComEC/Rec2 family competence protein [Aureivirga marina]|uniref:hypothetical protein n=1 Tax=Aureivirga marina TaxID=1182451 RepID=UPI0018CB6468|nr:hypothetical protein [Aureivirga marina]